MDYAFNLGKRKLLSILFLTIAVICAFALIPELGAEEKEVISLQSGAQEEVELRFQTSHRNEIVYEIFTLDNPARLVIDFPNAFYKAPDTDVDAWLQHSGYKRLRFVNHPEKARIVLDSSFSTLSPFSIQSRGRELRLLLKPVETEETLPAASEKSARNNPGSKASGVEHMLSNPNLPITVDFKGTDIQNVFRFLAEINHLNVVMGDDVNGTVTLRLKDVPWKQVMNIVLKTRQLGMEQDHNVIRIAPLEVFNKEHLAREERKRTLAESRKTEEDIQPTTMKILKVNFASIDEVADKIRNTITSDRGKVETDPRTNSLIINDIQDRIIRAENLLRELDEPVRQVMIEAKIVKVERRSARELGVQWGGAWNNRSNDRYYGLSGNNTLGNTGLPAVGDGASPDLASSYAVNLPATSLNSGIGLIFGKIDKYNLNVKLSAMQGRGDAHILSSPKVLALNQHSARIGQGQEIPYQTTSQEGTTTEFKKAELSLEVTPTITNNAMVSMEVVVSKDSKGENTPDGPAINTQTITTSLLLSDGETAVVGGIIESSKSKDNDSVPVLGHIPLFGWLFKHDYSDTEQTELMIFITPKIIK
ncbi:MAG TPA: type IV pilus secretin family protein [Proteobacteria bacterium]|nr:type IV pilus secretin family protein [Pseudomonadota bacterium]